MNSTRTLVLLCACLAPGASFAAAAPEPEAAASAAGYRSAFETYRSHRDGPVADWRVMNADVARAGGHIGIMRSPPDTGPAQAPVRDEAKAPGARTN